MGRHTTPGAPEPDSRDEVIGWGAFSTGLAAVLVGVAAGWVHGVTVALLGGLATAALWYVRTPRDAGTGRGRHASETPWSASDLLELKDGTDDGTGRRASADGGRRASRRRVAPDDAVPEPVPAPDADGGAAEPDLLDWVMGTDRTPQDVRPPSDRRRSGRRAARAAADGPDATDTPDGTGAAAVAPPDGLPPAPRRRSRRAADRTGAPARAVLPVAPFEMAAVSPARTPAARTVRAAEDPSLPDGTDGLDAADGLPPDLPEADLVPVDTGDAAAAMSAAPSHTLPADPLAGPVDPSWLAAEPTVLDPAHDGLWGAPALELTAEHPVAQEHPVDLGPPHEPHDRAREAAAIDAQWARRARRPQRPRGARAVPRPTGPRREPAPRPSSGYEAAEPMAEHPDPMVVVLPEPDVPDVLMLPESGVLTDGSPAADGFADADAPDRPSIPASRPAPGTMSLDELLVLHTRRPSGRRAGSPQRQGDEGARRLE